MELRPGQALREAATFADKATGRPTLQLTTDMPRAQTPTYHFNAAFTADSQSLLLVISDEEGSAIVRACVQSGDMTVVAATLPGPGPRFSGMNLACVQVTHQAVAVLGRSLRLYDLTTGAERLLIDDCGSGHHFGHPIATADGRRVVITRTCNALPHTDGSPRSRAEIAQWYADTLGGMPTTYLEVDLSAGCVQEALHEPIAGNNHAQPSPADPNLWLIDRDWPPTFNLMGDGGRTTRAWLYRRKSGAFTELRPRDPNRFQIHTNWNRAGTRVYYHGGSLRNNPAAQADGRIPVRQDFDGQYIGVAETNGRVVWEHHVPGYHYGHVCTDTRGEAIVTDGLVTRHQITAIHYEDRDAAGRPRLETLAQHDTSWGDPPGQWSHPHCHMSPDGRWLSYNRSEPSGRCTVCVVDLLQPSR